MMTIILCASFTSLIRFDFRKVDFISFDINLKSFSGCNLHSVRCWHFMTHWAHSRTSLLVWYMTSPQLDLGFIPISLYNSSTRHHLTLESSEAWNVERRPIFWIENLDKPWRDKHHFEMLFSPIYFVSVYKILKGRQRPSMHTLLKKWYKINLQENTTMNPITGSWFLHGDTPWHWAFSIIYYHN